MSRREHIERLRRTCQPEGLDLSLYRRRVIRPVSVHLTAFLLRLGASANGVSVAKGVVACVGAALFASRSVTGPLVGCLLLQLAFLLDACDGELARLRETDRTAGGEYLDKLGDAASRSLLHLCWGIGAWMASGRPAWVLCGGALAGLWLVQRFCLMETLLESLSSHPGTAPSHGEENALRRLFVVSRASSGGVEHALSVLYHPMINLVTLLVLLEAALAIAGVESAAGLSPRGLGLATYSLLWLANFLRKLRSGYPIADFERPRR